MGTILNGTTDGMIKAYDRAAEALREIAIGRLDCGRPLASEKSRQIARAALIEIGEDWKRERVVGGE